MILETTVESRGDREKSEKNGSKKKRRLTRKKKQADHENKTDKKISQVIQPIMLRLRIC